MSFCEQCPIKNHGECLGQKIPQVCERVKNNDENLINYLQGKYLEDSKIKPAYPSLTEQTKNIAGAIVGYAKSGFLNVSDEVYTERLTICANCKEFDAKARRCQQCGCFIPAKAKMAYEKCPLELWVSQEEIQSAQFGCGGCGSKQT